MFFARSVAPLILYGCSAVLVLLLIVGLGVGLRPGRGARVADVPDDVDVAAGALSVPVPDDEPFSVNFPSLNACVPVHVLFCPRHAIVSFAFGSAKFLLFDDGPVNVTKPLFAFPLTSLSSSANWL